MPSNIQQKVVFSSPRSLQERTNVADSCVHNLHIEIPALVDNFSNGVETAYTGWPDRLYLIDREGRVAYKSGPGPFGFHARDLGSALKRMLD